MTSDAGLYDDALVTFFAEAREMLQQLEDTLMALESAPDDRELINALFRAAHTIKGSAGLFGLDRVVGFTHQVESVLDCVRKGELAIDLVLSDRLLKSSDIMSALLNQAEQKTADQTALVQLDEEAAAMALLLGSYLAGASVSPVAADAEVVQTGTVAGTWHISLRFGLDAFRNGFDPISVIAYLGTVGELVRIMTIDDQIPGLQELDPEACHLGFEIRLHTTASMAEIDGAFDFVRDDCTIQIIAPTRRADDFIALIDASPNQGRLGDVLVECGALTREALDKALAAQTQSTNATSTSAPASGRLLGEILVDRHQVSTEVVQAVLVKQGKSRDPKADDSRFLRVHADKLDELINLVGELVICGAGASLLAQAMQNPEMLETTQRMSGLVEEMRNGTLALRMVQIGETFARYRRVVRDTSAELGKEIQLEIDGAETELDKSVVEKIVDPLMHLVRNAMDHGIEAPAIRLAAGKPAHGTLRLSARHDSGHILIQVADDGKGLDGEMLLTKARERGLVQPTQVLSETEKLNLIFEPGFSTAEKITNLSGRGVGMDVVRKNIEALRGTVVLDSKVGRGTTIEIRLPLTLAIIDGFLVRVGKNSYVIPLHAVVECIDAPPELLRVNLNGTGHIDLRSEVLPYLELRTVFGDTEAIPPRRSIVVVKSQDSYAGLVVDQLQGEYQTVIKPLGRLFSHLRGISGSTVLGSGEVALILDVPALIKVATDKEILVT